VIGRGMIRRLRRRLGGGVSERGEGREVENGVVLGMHGIDKR